MSEVMLAKTWCKPHLHTDTMLASTGTMPPPAHTGLYFNAPLFDQSSLPMPASSGQRVFKKHKVLPHPRNNNGKQVITYNLQSKQRLAVDTQVSSSNSSSQPSSPRSLKHANRRVGGPALPPTPPAHSRTSSSGQSVQPSSPTCVDTPGQSVSGIPGTPPNQRSPPTPDVTPPQQTRRPKLLRPTLTDRIPSNRTTDSRTSSFKTARSTIDSSEDEKSTLRPVLPSGRTSQSTVRQATDEQQKKSQNVGLGLGLESEDNLTTPRAGQEFFTFDAESGSGSEVEQEWDSNLNRNVMVRKRRAKPRGNGGSGAKRQKDEVVEAVTVTPINATKALRYMPLQERMQTYPSLQDSAVANRDNRWTAPSASESSVSTDARRFSGMSSKSTVSTIVEAILVDHNATPQRQKTLRHVKKQTILRDSVSDLSHISPTSSAANSFALLDDTITRPRARRRADGARTESFASTGTVNSLASRKARREVWKNGGIPVVVIPDRWASAKATRTPSLRSTSTSRRSHRTNSMNSVPLSSALSNHTKSKDLTPYFDRPSRRDRAMSESDGSLPGDQRTIDYPPIVPVRRSSLSAPTSRNGSVAGSRAGSRSSSLTVESLKAHNAFLDQHQTRAPPQVTVERAPSMEQTRADRNNLDQKQLQPAVSLELHRDAPNPRPLVDHNGDPFFGKRLTTHNTPFSQASVETNGTHSTAKVSEAMAVNIYPHQNKSVLMVDHTNALQREKSGGTDTTEKAPQVDKSNNNTINLDPNGGPVTPPQPIFSMDEVDSPLRNPRAPPEPPAIKLTPATPSGLTPAAEKMKMLGNYFEEESTIKRPSLVKRAFSLNRSGSSGQPGLLSRTLSLTKNMLKDTAENPALDKDQVAVSHQYPNANGPRDDARLHPFWQPSTNYDAQDDDDWLNHVPDEVDQIYCYPAMDDRPAPPRRSLSSRMKRTFAILPISDDEHEMGTNNHRPAHPTLSGSLSAMRSRDSSSSLRWRRPSLSSDEGEIRPLTAQERPGHRVWGIEKRVDSRGQRLFPGWQDKVEQYGIQGIQRRLSEHKRQKRTEALRQKISGPREVRDGVGEVVKRNSYRGPSYQTPSPLTTGGARGRHRYVEGVERAPMVQAQV